MNAAAQKTIAIANGIVKLPAADIKEAKPPPSKKMKKWSDDPSKLTPYSNLIHPLKNIILKGYKLMRNDIKSFEYDGYNIGKEELLTFHSPKNQLTEKFIAREDKRNVKLIDIVLHITFLLGVEQGRRAERREQKSTEALINTIDQYRETNKNLRYQIDELKATAKVKQDYPLISQQDLTRLVQEEVDKTRDKRIAALRADLQLDPTKSSFNVKVPPRAKFHDLVALSKTLSKADRKANWIGILKEYGWTSEEWYNKCKKKSVIVLD